MWRKRLLLLTKREWFSPSWSLPVRSLIRRFASRPKPRAKRVKKATVSPEPHEASVDRGPEVEELQQPAEEQPASATLELPQVEHAEGDAADEQHEILDNGQAAVPEQAMEYHADHAATEAPYQHPITATEFEDQRVLELLGSLESGTAALRTGEQVDTQHFLHEVEQITAGVEADPAAAYIPEYVGYPTYSDQKPKKRSGGMVKILPREFPVLTRSPALARNTGGRAKTVAVPHKKFRIDDKVFLVAEDQWYRVTGFFEGLAAEGVAQVSAATKKMTASAINGDVGTKVVQMDAEDAPNTKLWAAADPGLADVVGTPVPEAAPSFDGSVSEMAPGSPAPTKAKDIRPKDRDFWWVVFCCARWILLIC